MTIEIAIDIVIEFALELAFRQPPLRSSRVICECNEQIVSRDCDMDIDS